MKYKIVTKNPVIRCYYQGQSHSHPVRRTGLKIDETPKTITVIELREGNEVRDFKDGKIKVYRKDRVARWGDYCRLRNQKPKKEHNRTTLQRAELFDLVENGA